jgi:hypothetical protein
MGQKTSSLDIQNEVSTFLQETQKQMVNLTTQSIVNISHKIVQEQISNVISNAAASNIFNGYRIIVKNGAKFSVSQQNNLKATVQAILNITQDNNLALDLTNQIKSNIKSSLAQNAQIADNVAAAAQLLKDQKSSGEINTAINAVSDVATKVFTSLKATEDKNKIRNKLIQEVALLNKSTANIDNYINTIINQNINQTTINNCINNSYSSNILNLRYIVVDGPNATFKVTQSNILDTFYKCMISSTLKTSQLQSLANNILNNTNLSSSQGASLSSNLSGTKKNVFSDISTSILDSTTGIIVVVIIVVFIIIIIIFFIMRRRGASSFIMQSSPPPYPPYQYLPPAPHNKGRAAKQITDVTTKLSNSDPGKSFKKVAPRAKIKAVGKLISAGKHRAAAKLREAAKQRGEYIELNNNDEPGEDENHYIIVEPNKDISKGYFRNPPPPPLVNLGEEAGEEAV